MVKRIFNIFYKEIVGLHEAAYLLGIFALLSQLLALVRDRMFASHFGASTILDVYYSSFRIPDFIFATVASLVSISVIVPFITERLGKDQEEGKKFINSIFYFFSILIVSTSVIAFFLIPYLVPLIFKGLSAENFPSIILTTRILLLSPILLGLSNFFASLTQVGKRFLVYALSPLFYNLGIILGIIFLYPIWGIYGLALGVVFGAIMHLAIQLPFVFKSGLFKPWPAILDFQSIKNVVAISIPRTITLGMTQISIIALLGIASFMERGSISIFNFALNLQSVPLTIIGVSYSIAAFPTLARLFTNGQRDEFVSHIITGARHILFWSIPVSVLFIVLRAQVVRTIYGAGNFSWSDTKLTAGALAIFAISVVAQSLVLLFVRGFYATGNTKKSLYTSIGTGVFTIIFSYLFVKIFNSFLVFRYFIEHLFRVDDLIGTDVLMLALGFSLAQVLNCMILWMLFERDFKGFSAPLLNTLFQTFSASVIMGFVAYLGLNIFDNLFNINTLVGIFMQGLCSGLLGIAAFILVMKCMKSVELEETIKTLHKKFWKVRPIIPDTKEL
jgi:putative peptidoglycan lipid II flippase